MTDNLVSNHEFISDCCRFFENLMTEAAMRRKYTSLTERDWERLGSDERLIAEVELEKARRIRSGATKREKAQSLIAEAVDILGGIALDPKENARHRIDATKALDALADPGPTHAPDSSERFTIRIDLTAGGNKDDVIVIDKPTRKVGPDVAKTIEHDDPDTMPLFAAITANKSRNGGDGEPL
jgi:hypothetical protein